MIEQILIIPKIQIAEANAFSSPFTVGFPAMTAWLGAVHALERKFTDTKFSEFNVTGVGVVSHDFNLRSVKSGYTTSLIGERHPLKKDGKSPSFVEEPKCHLTASIVIRFTGLDPDIYDLFLLSVETQLHKMRIAGGIILTFQKPLIMKLDAHSDSYEVDFKRVTSRLMPGYALIERRDLVLNAMNEGQDVLEAIIEGLAVTHRCDFEPPAEDHADQKVEWSKATKKHSGWIVPIATGFHGLTEPAIALNQRDSETLHRFAEALVTLGEFKMPHKLQSLNDLIWSYHYDEENNLYTCTQNNN